MPPDFADLLRALIDFYNAPWYKKDSAEDALLKACAKFKDLHPELWP